MTYPGYPLPSQNSSKSTPSPPHFIYVRKLCRMIGTTAATSQKLNKKSTRTMVICKGGVLLVWIKVHMYVCTLNKGSL